VSELLTEKENVRLDLVWERQLLAVFFSCEIKKLKLENDDMVGGFQLPEWREKFKKKHSQISILGFQCVAKNIRA
jgi:hypothetical protein